MPLCVARFWGIIAGFRFRRGSARTGTAPVRHREGDAVCGCEELGVGSLPSLQPEGLAAFKGSKIDLAHAGREKQAVQGAAVPEGARSDQLCQGLGQVEPPQPMAVFKGGFPDGNDPFRQAELLKLCAGGEGCGPDEQHVGRDRIGACAFSARVCQQGGHRPVKQHPARGQEGGIVLLYIDAGQRVAACKHPGPDPDEPSGQGDAVEGPGIAEGPVVDGRHGAAAQGRRDDELRRATALAGDGSCRQPLRLFDQPVYEPAAVHEPFRARHPRGRKRAGQTEAEKDDDACLHGTHLQSCLQDDPL